MDSTEKANLSKMDIQAKKLYKGRRRSRSLGGTAVKGLSEIIPTTLPPEARIEKLIKLSFHHSLCVVKQEFNMKQINNPDIKAKSNELWEKIRSSLEGKNLFISAVSDDICTTEITKLEKVCAFDNAKAKYEKELKAWDELVSTHRKDLKDVLEESGPLIVSADIDMKNELLDYSTILRKLSSEMEEINLQIKKFSKMHHTAVKCLRLSDKYKSALYKKAEKRFEKHFPDTPRKTIRKLVFSHKLENGSRH